VSQPTTPPTVRVSNATLGYNHRTVLKNLSLDVAAHSITALYGHNGAGKTTLLNAIAGFIKPTAGNILINGNDVTRLDAPRRARSGIRLVPQGEGIFPNLTVAENLAVAHQNSGTPTSVDELLEVFPDLSSKMPVPAGGLSGGQRQMLAIAMALVDSPHLLLLDEPSTGLAPVLVDQVFSTLRALHDSTGVTILVAEQNFSKTQLIADDAVVVQLGSVVFTGTSQELDAHSDLLSLM
jgi:branched-chain amino acid transport system ATP-binding protein